MVVSRRVNAVVLQALSRNALVDVVGGKTVDLALSMRRWQLSFIEDELLDTLRRRDLSSRGMRLDVSAMRPAKARRPFLARTRLRLRRYVLGAYKALRLWMLKRLKEALGTRRPARLWFVDGNEIKVTRIGGRRYVYHKYLEGVVDFDGPRIEDDTLVVLYGDLRDVPRAVLHHPRVVLLGLFNDRRTLAPLLARASLVANACHESCFHGVPMPLGLRRRLHGVRRRLEDVMRDDLRILESADRLLSLLGGPLEIVLDNYDSTLFTLSQHLLAHTRHTVVAMQKVLGPYTLSFNVRGHGGAFRLPHRILAWGTFHRERLARLGYDCEIQVEGMHRIALYREFVRGGRPHSRSRVRAALGAPQDRPVVMFSAVGRVLGFPLIDALSYVAMLRDLAALANAGRCFVVFKPWPGEDTGHLQEVVRSLFARGTWRLVDVRFSARFHNLELLLASDVLISTVSSMIGEAMGLGTVPVLVTQRSAERYFSSSYTRRFRRFCPVIDEESGLREILEPLLDAGAREAILAARPEACVALFGTAYEPF